MKTARLLLAAWGFVLNLACTDEKSSGLAKLACEDNRTASDAENCTGPQSTPASFPAVEAENGTLISRLFSEVQKACLEATGHGLNAGMQCLCGDETSPEVDQVFDAKTKSCKTPRTDHGEAFARCRKEGFRNIFASRGRRGLAECLETVMAYAPDNPLDVTVQSISLTKGATEAEAGALAAWADAELEKENPFFARLWRPVGGVDTAYFKTGRIREDLLSELSFESLLSNTMNTSFHDTSGNSLWFYEPEPSALSQIMGQKRWGPGSEALWPAPEAELLQGDPVTGELYAAHKLWVEEITFFKVERGYSLKGRGCLDLCLIAGEPFLSGTNTARVIRTYSGGSVVKQILWLWDASQRLTGAVIYGLNERPVFYVSVRWELSGEDLSLHLTLYDRRFHRIQSGQSRVIADLNGTLMRLEAATDIDSVPDRGAIIACEDFNPSEVRPLEKLVKGRFPLVHQGSQLSRGAFWGYGNQDTGDWLQSLGSVRENPLTLGSYLVEYAYSHGQRVMNQLLEVWPEAYIIPGGKCFYNAEHTHEVMTQTGGSGLTQPRSKVMNVSFAYPESSESCHEKFSPVVKAWKDRMLIVMGAGNRGSGNPHYCPQRIQGPNTIVVSGADAASTGNPQLWRHSDYGENYADIAADYHGTDGMTGTSFAAPKVSAVAGRISRAHENLTPGDVKMILLSSAFVPYKRGWKPLKVRSGGVLRAEAAYAMASCLSEQRGKISGAFSGEQVRSCLVQEGLYSSRMASKKVAFLSERGIL